VERILGTSRLFDKRFIIRLQQVRLKNQKIPEILFYQAIHKNPEKPPSNIPAQTKPKTSSAIKT
jgi:hypothetical protein